MYENPSVLFDKLSFAFLFSFALRWIIDPFKYGLWTGLTKSTFGTHFASCVHNEFGFAFFVGPCCALDECTIALKVIILSCYRMILPVVAVRIDLFGPVDTLMNGC